MDFLRVFSVMIDDGEHKPDTKTKLVLHVKVSGENKIDRKVQVFGYSEEWDESAYRQFPIMLEFKSGFGRLYYVVDVGAKEPPSERLNIYDKEISEGNTFTWFCESDNKEYEAIYRIEKVSKL